jgi:hypothetical protein
VYSGTRRAYPSDCRALELPAQRGGSGDSNRAFRRGGIAGQPPRSEWRVVRHASQQHSPSFNERELHLTLGDLPDESLTDEAYVPRILREWSVDGLLINYIAASRTR